MFAFFIHPRDVSKNDKYHDIERITRMYGVLPFGLYIPIGWLTQIIARLPISWKARVLPLFPPMVTGKIYSRGKTLGWIVTIPWTSRQMLDAVNGHGSRQSKKALHDTLVEAVRISKEMGAQIVGLGAMTAPVSAGGLHLVGKVKGVGITNGNALTAVMNQWGMEAVAKKTDINLDSAKIAIVGATGSVGMASVWLLAHTLKGGNFLLISRTPAKLQQLKERIEKHYCDYPNIKIAISQQMSDLRDCDIILVTTSNADELIGVEHLKPGAVIYDDTQPRNVAKEVADDPRFLVVDGSIVRIPDVYNTMDIGLPLRADMYACLAETCLLSIEGLFDDFAVGREVFEQSKRIWPVAIKHRLGLAPFRSYGRELIEQDCERIKKIRKMMS